MENHLFESLVAYGFATVFAIIIGLIVGIILWLDNRRASTVALSTGAAIGAVLTLATAVLDQFLA
jgi:ABC-type methionine transport system permease subunit